MENLETYLYVIVAVIYIIVRIIKARSKQNQPKRPIVKPQQQMQPQPAKKTSGPKKAFSFEDILKEFEKNLTGEEVVQEKALPVKEIKHEKPAPVAVNKTKEKTNKYQKYKHKTYKDGKEIIRKKMVFERSEAFKIKESIASEYVRMLQDPEGFKNAVVLSEIINRKYF